MKIYTNWAFLRPVNTSLHGDFTIENPSFSMSLLSTQEHTIPLCVKILQILFWLVLSWFWIEGNGRFWDFLTFYVPLCSKKLSVQCGSNLADLKVGAFLLLAPSFAVLQKKSEDDHSALAFVCVLLLLLLGYRVIHIHSSLKLIQVTDIITTTYVHKWISKYTMFVE